MRLSAICRGTLMGSSSVCSGSIVIVSAMKQLFLLLSISVCALAQDQARIAGTVTDPSGAVIPKASVTAADGCYGSNGRGRRVDTGGHQLGLHRRERKRSRSRHAAAEWPPAFTTLPADSRRADRGRR